MPTNNPTVNYLSRDFAGFRTDLINFAKTYHADKLAYMNDANPDVMYLEMVAYVGDVLSYYTDKTFNESFLSTALARESMYRIATDLGFFELGPTPSQTQVIFSIKVPFVSDPSTGTIKPDPDMLVALKNGTQISSDTGVVFEVLEEVSFADPRNRKVIPNLDSNNQVEDYTIEKSAVAIAGTTKIQRFYVSPDKAKPFLQVILDDISVNQVLGAVSSPGNVYVAPVDDDFVNPEKAYLEVRTLIEAQKFIEINPTDQYEQNIFQETTVRPGNFVDIPKRFIGRYDVNGLLTLTFGSGNPNFGAFNNIIQNFVNANTLSLNQVLNNTALGEVPPPDSTLFIKYRVGGGSKSNVIVGQINTINAKTYFPITGSPNLTTLQTVRNSLKVRNDLPAIGGRDEMTNEEIRQSVGKIYAAQDRAVTYEDVKALIERMPPEFGRPYRIAYEEIKPRVANFTQVRSGVTSLVSELLQQTDSVARQIKADEIQIFLNQLQNGAAYIPVSGNNSVVVATSVESANVLSATPSLWLGEKCRLYVLGIDENEQLTTAFKNTLGVWIYPNEALKLNIRNFLRSKRVIGDWIDIVDGQVVNYQIDFTVLVDKKNKQQVLTDCLTKLRDYVATTNWQMNQPIFVANVQTALQEIDGVINVVEIKFINIWGVDSESNRVYAAQETGRYFNINTTPLNTQNNKFLMSPVNNIILSTPSMIFEVKYPDSDLVGRAI